MSQLLILTKMQIAALSQSFLRAGKRRKKGNAEKKAPVGRIIAVCALLLYLIAIFVALFITSFAPLAEAYGQAGLGWLYFSLSFLSMSFLMLFGSVFFAKAMLFEAKDNDLLLSMPIAPHTILLSRMLSLLLLNLAYGIIVAGPALGCWIYFNGANILTIVFFVLLFLATSLFVLGITCLLGWALSIIGSFIRNKTLITVIATLAFIAVYYYFIGTGALKMMKILVEQGEMIAGKLGIFLPLYWYGAAIADGDPLAFLLTLILLAAVFALVFSLLSKTFFRIATTSRGHRKEAYHAKSMKTASPMAALLKRETMRLCNNATYLLNACLSLLFLLIGGGFLLYAKDMLYELQQMTGITDDKLPVIAVIAACFLLSMVLLTPPSVSLEGKTLWILRSMPIHAKDILLSKLYFHLVWSVPPTLFFSVISAVILTHDPVTALLTILVPLLFTVANGALGLIYGVIFANFSFISEAHAVKQSVAVLLSMLTGAVLVIVPGALWWFLALPAIPFCLCYAAVLALLSAGAIAWITKAGAKRLDAYSA